MKVLVVAVLVLMGDCSSPLKAAEPKRPRCFDVLAVQNSAATQAEFQTRQCQAGGVTWAALVRVVLQRRGKITVDHTGASDMTGDVLNLEGQGRFSIDDEGDAARFCADAPALVSLVQADIDRLNHDLAALRGAMNEADPVALECSLLDGGALQRP